MKGINLPYSVGDEIEFKGNDGKYFCPGIRFKVIDIYQMDGFVLIGNGECEFVVALHMLKDVIVYKQPNI